MSLWTLRRRVREVAGWRRPRLVAKGDPDRDQVLAHLHSATFTAFCEQLLAAHPTAPVVAVICDNVIIHRSKIVGRWLRKHPRLRVLHGARATARTLTRSSGSGAHSRHTWPTARP
jgi:hypothetical protein